MELNDVHRGVYKHSKSGNLYEVIGVGKDSETLEDVVVYKALYDNPVSQLWVRPKKMFVEKVVLGGKKVPRFQFIK